MHLNNCDLVGYTMLIPVRKLYNVSTANQVNTWCGHVCVLLIVLLCVYRLIQQCAANSSKAIATDLWTKSGLTWTALGLDQPEEEFLEREVPFIIIMIGL